MDRIPSGHQLDRSMVEVFCSVCIVCVCVCVFASAHYGLLTLYLCTRLITPFAMLAAGFTATHFGAIQWVERRLFVKMIYLQCYTLNLLTVGIALYQLGTNTMPSHRICLMHRFFFGARIFNKTKRFDLFGHICLCITEWLQTQMTLATISMVCY